MKKQITCAMVFGVFTAGTASAAITVFEKDDFSYQLSGDLQIQLRQDSGIDEDLDVNYDDGELKNRFEYKLGDGLVGFGELDFEVSKDNDVTREEAYIGLAKDNMSFFIGSSDYVTDDFGVERNIDVGDVGGDVFILDNSDDLISFAYSTDQYSIGISHDLEVDDDETSTDLLLETEIENFEVAFAFQTASNIVLENLNGGVVLSDADTFGLSVEYDLGEYEVALSYSSIDIDAAPDSISNIHLVGTAKPKSTTEFNLGFDIVDVGSENSATLGLSDVDSWYVNAIYKFPQVKGFSTFAEIGESDVDGVSDIDIGFLAGLRLVF